MFPTAREARAAVSMHRATVTDRAAWEDARLADSEVAQPGFLPGKWCYLMKDKTCLAVPEPVPTGARLRDALLKQVRLWLANDGPRIGSRTLLLFFRRGAAWSSCARWARRGSRRRA